VVWESTFGKHSQWSGKAQLVSTHKWLQMTSPNQSHMQAFLTHTHTHTKWRTCNIYEEGYHFLHQNPFTLWQQNQNPIYLSLNRPHLLALTLLKNSQVTSYRLDSSAIIPVSIRREKQGFQINFISTQYTVHSIQYTVDSTQHTVHSAQYIYDIWNQCIHLTISRCNDLWENILKKMVLVFHKGTTMNNFYTCVKSNLN
jgi:hypothetical protein